MLLVVGAMRFVSFFPSFCNQVDSILLKHSIHYFCYKFRLTFVSMFLQTAVAVGVELENQLPTNNEYYEYFGPDYTLFNIENPSPYPNNNSPEYLEKIK